MLLLDDVFAELDTARRRALAGVAATAEQGAGHRGGRRGHPADWDARRIGITPAGRRGPDGSRWSTRDRLGNDPESPAGPPEHPAGCPAWTWCGAHWRRPGAAQPGQGGRPRPAVPAARRSAGGGRRPKLVGSGPDRRDPQPFGSAAKELAASRGWSPRVAEGTVFAQWPAVVGEQIAEHAEPPRCGRVLSVAAESTAWATQLRMVQAQLLAKIAGRRRGRGGHRAEDHRPGGPVLAQGPRHISGRGPRDTYG